MGSFRIRITSGCGALSNWRWRTWFIRVLCIPGFTIPSALRTTLWK
jgi:hypothetical protein